jgi:hypothetical protein
MAHGTFSNFKDLGAMMGVIQKCKPDSSKPRKCPICGNPLKRCDGSNVYACDSSALKDEVLPDGTSVQVFTKCSYTEFVNMDRPGYRH